MSSVSKPKVICLGLARTGNTSLRQALDMLDFGPSYNMDTIMQEGGEDFATWNKIGDGNGTKEGIGALLQGYRSVLDPAMMYTGSAELYSAYPDAKYILTTRDPAEWEKAMKAIMQYALQYRREACVHIRPSPIFVLVEKWGQTHLDDKYHRGRLWTHSREEMIAHNDRIKQLIPSEKLVVFEFGEGWERLVEFLGVPMPTVPFLNVCDTEHFLERFKSLSV